MPKKQSKKKVSLLTKPLSNGFTLTVAILLIAIALVIAFGKSNLVKEKTAELYPVDYTTTPQLSVDPVTGE
jgi:hypothetical protein